MSKILRFETGHFDNKSTFPEWKKGDYFHGKSDEVFSGKQLENADFIFIEESNKFIKFDGISAFRWSIIDDLSDDPIYNVEIKIINPELAHREEVIKAVV